MEGVRSSLIAQNKPIIDFSQIKIAGCLSAIEQIIKRVFRPRKLSSEMRQKLGRQCWFSIYITSSVYFIGFQFVRGVILYGPPGTGKTTIVKYVIQINSIFLVNKYRFVLKSTMRIFQSET